METLNGTSWDIAIAGTGLQPALLALALSRSGKKILHLDRNDYYGGREAALSISEVEEWVEHVKADSSASALRNISIQRHDGPSDGPKLAAPRSYSLSLSPCLLYTRSALLPALVSSKAHEQLEFLAVGSWFVWRPTAQTPTTSTENAEGSQPNGSLIRVPNSREDIFSDASLTLRAKSALVKFLRFVAVYQDEDKKPVWESYKDQSFAEFLSKQFKIQPEFHGPLLALTMSTQSSDHVTTLFALQSIHRHLTSMGVFGAGFSAVLPKYGGLSEVVQVACRAAAVGGAVYVLDREIEAISTAPHTEEGTGKPRVRISLQGGDQVNAGLVFATDDQLPPSVIESRAVTLHQILSRKTTIVASRLQSLFPAPAEGSPPPSAAVVVFPSQTLTGDSGIKKEHPIHVLVHNGDTGECPAGQCVIYASTLAPLDQASSLLDMAIDRILADADTNPDPILWSMKYEVHSSSEPPLVLPDPQLPGLYRFSEPPINTVFDDATLSSVQEAWKLCMGEEGAAFLQFGDRNIAEEEQAEDDADE